MGKEVTNQYGKVVIECQDPDQETCDTGYYRHSVPLSTSGGDDYLVPLAGKTVSTIYLKLN